MSSFWSLHDAYMHPFSFRASMKVWACVRKDVIDNIRSSGPLFRSVPPSPSFPQWLILSESISFKNVHKLSVTKVQCPS